MFTIQEKYLVFKYKDLLDLSTQDQDILCNLIDRVNEIRGNRGRTRLKCVVVEDDWPEYEQVRKLIEDRCNE